LPHESCSGRVEWCGWGSGRTPISTSDSVQPDAEAFLARAVAGETAAIEQLLIPYQSRLLARLERKLPPGLRSIIAPEDLLQETFIEVFRQIRTFQPTGIGAFIRWLVMVTDGRLIQAIRHHSTLKRGGGRVSLDPMIEGSSAIPLLELLHVDAHSPSRSVAGHEATSAVAVGLRSLKPEYRDAVRMRFLEGLDVTEIAHRLGRTEWSVHKLCSRGLQELRHFLGNESGFLSRG